MCYSPLKSQSYYQGANKLTLTPKQILIPQMAGTQGYAQLCTCKKVSHSSVILTQAFLDDFNNLHGKGSDFYKCTHMCIQNLCLESFPSYAYQYLKARQILRPNPSISAVNLANTVIAQFKIDKTIFLN